MAGSQQIRIFLYSDNSELTLTSEYLQNSRNLQIRSAFGSIARITDFTYALLKFIKPAMRHGNAS